MEGASLTLVVLIWTWWGKKEKETKQEMKSTLSLTGNGELFLQRSILIQITATHKTNRTLIAWFYRFGFLMMKEFYIYKLIKTTFIIDHHQLNTFRTYTHILSLYFNIVFLPQLAEVIEIHFTNPEEHNININFHSEHCIKRHFSIIKKEKYYLAYLNEAYTVYDRVQ